MMIIWGAFNFWNRKYALEFISFLFFLNFFTVMGIQEGFAITNSMTIKEKAGLTTNDYPIQIGRAFVQGEIPNFPQVLVNGTPIVTQADVKSIWAGGSVKHAILTFLIPTLTANSTVTVTFRNQSSGNNTGYLDKTGMMGAGYDFEAVMELINVSTQTASARTMLNADAFTYWLQGPVATSIILADHSASRAYDIGFDANKSFRPIFHATFWPTINKVRVRFIGEIANSQYLQDQVYSLVLKTGITPSQVYSKSSFTHYGASRWTKELWIGGAPTAIEINHNLAYLVTTKAIPNYDTSKVVPEATLASSYSAWTGTSKDLYDAGNWTKQMSMTGGRPDLGPYPAWTVQWLYSGDYRMRDKAFGNADLAAAWPMHVREGAVKYFDRDHVYAGLGRVLSVAHRPTISFGSGWNYGADKVTLVGSMSNGGWTPDVAHVPEAFTPQYMLSGDFWYLEEAYFWTSWIAAWADGGATTNLNGRGPTGAEGGLPYSMQVRGQAWGLRSRVNVAALAPDASAEKVWFETMIADTLAQSEGKQHITTGIYYQGGANANWNWADTYARGFTDPGVSPLHHWDQGEAIFVTDDISPSLCSKGTNNYEHGFLMFSFGRAKELGYSADAIVTWLGSFFINQVNTYSDPYHSGSYRLPTKKSDNTWFSSWNDMEAAYVYPYYGYTPAGWFNSDYGMDADQGYAMVAMCAVSAAAGESGGSAAWNWMASHALTNSYLNANPKWAILPRSGSVLPPDTTPPAAPRNLRIR